MNKIVFPGLNLEFNISQIALQIGSLQVYWYAIFIVFGIALSLVLLHFTKNKYGIAYEEFLEIAILTLISGFIGARLFYVLFNLDYYLENWVQVFNTRNGGLAIFGGIIFGGLTSYIVCRKKNINFLDFCDLVVPYLVLTQGIGRLGNFFNVEAYGTVTHNIFRMGIQTYNGYIEVHPCFLYEMVGCIIIFIVLKILQKRQKYQGEILSFYLILYGILRFFVESLRSDSLIFLSFKVSQFISLVCIILGTSIYIKNKLCRNKSNKVDQK